MVVFKKEIVDTVKMFSMRRYDQLIIAAIIILLVITGINTNTLTLMFHNVKSNYKCTKA